MWKLVIFCSPMFSLSRKLLFVRHRLRKWCLTNKRLWGINWQNLLESIQILGNQVSDFPTGASYLQHVSDSHQHAQIKFNYWSQRMKQAWVAKGDCPSK